MAEDLIQQMWKNIRDCERFSLQLDKYMNVTDKAQMCIFTRMMFSDIIARGAVNSTSRERTYAR